MNNHFGKGLMAGLKATHADSAVNAEEIVLDSVLLLTARRPGCGGNGKFQLGVDAEKMVYNSAFACSGRC